MLIQHARHIYEKGYSRVTFSDDIVVGMQLFHFFVYVFILLIIYIFLLKVYKLSQKKNNFYSLYNCIKKDTLRMKGKLKLYNSFSTDVSQIKIVLFLKSFLSFVKDINH